MWYLALIGTCAVWVFFDARLRKSKLPAVWAAGTAVFGLLVLPIFLATRPLKTGEIREGGLGWQVCKNFAILWAIVMGSFMVRTFVSLVGSTVSLRNEIQVAGMAFGFGIMLSLWLAVLIGAATIALLLKKSFVLEKAPTAAASSETENRSARSWLPWVAAAGFITLIIMSRIAYGLYNTEARKLHASEGDSPLVLAARKGDLVSLKNLVGRGADIVEALEIALRHDHSQASSFILGNIADRDEALRHAAEEGYKEAVKELLAKGADVRAKDTSQKTALHRALSMTATQINQPAIIQILLAHGADVNAKDDGSMTPLHYAAWKAPNAWRAPNVESIELLLASGAHLNEENRWEMTPLYFAMISYDPEIVQLLLERGADVNPISATGDGPLIWACCLGAEEDSKRENRRRIIRILMDHGARASVYRWNIQRQLLRECLGGNWR